MRHAISKGDFFMKLTFSNLLAIASISVWAAAWVATETKADAQTNSYTSPVATSSFQVAQP
jgi:hypothetical protein